MQECPASSTTPAPRRLRCVTSASGDVRRQPFLGLRAGGNVLDQAGQCGQPEDPAGGQVTHVRDPRKGRKVVRANRLERDFPGKHQVVMALLVGERRQP